MQSPYIGRGIALIVITGLIAWTAFRALGSRPPETPKSPFPAPAIDTSLAAAKAGKELSLLEAASGASKLSSSIYREYRA